MIRLAICSCGTCAGTDKALPQPPRLRCHLRPPMVLISGAEAPKCSGIVTDERSAHPLGDNQLPSVILAHTAGASLLSKRNTFSVYSMDTLPRIARQIGFDSLGVGGSFKHFGQRHRTDPELGSLVALEPRERRALDSVRNLIEQIDYKRGVQQALLHYLRDTRLLARYAQARVAHALSGVREHIRATDERFLPNEHPDICGTLHPRLTRTLGEHTLLFFGQTDSEYSHNDHRISRISFVCQQAAATI